MHGYGIRLKSWGDTEEIHVKFNVWNIHTKAIRPLTTFPGWQKPHYKETAGSISMTTGDTCHLCVCKRRRTPLCTVGLRRTQGALMLASGHSHLLSCFSVSWHLITGKASISTNWYHCFILYRKFGPYKTHPGATENLSSQSCLAGLSENRSEPAERWPGTRALTSVWFHKAWPRTHHAGTLIHTHTAVFAASRSSLTKFKIHRQAELCGVHIQEEKKKSKQDKTEM